MLEHDDKRSFMGMHFVLLLFKRTNTHKQNKENLTIHMFVFHHCWLIYDYTCTKLKFLVVGSARCHMFFLGSVRYPYPIIVSVTCHDRHRKMSTPFVFVLWIHVCRSCIYLGCFIWLNTHKVAFEMVDFAKKNKCRDWT